MDIAIIGGGAAGFFAAITCAETYPEHSVSIFEKSGKVLAKVRISGGGRCNVTHACFDNDRLIEFYPRGQKELRNAFSRFNTLDTVRWFESRGVKLKTEKDGRMFPVSDNSETIIQCLMREADTHRINLKMNYGLIGISVGPHGKFELKFRDDSTAFFDKVILTTGGSSSENSYRWISELGHTIVPPVPSLFTFNIPDSPLKGLEGISSQAVQVKITGSRFEAIGPILITHWGVSGPAVLRLSALAARWLHETEYKAMCLINWIPEIKEDDVRKEILQLKNDQPSKKVTLVTFHGITTRLWQRMCSLSGISESEKLGDINKEKISRLVQNCCQMQLNIAGKTTFKEEFVTCGGVNLKEVNFQTMESKKVKGLFFAGELLDIDGITGGFNFQAAWTTGYLAGMGAGNK